MRTDVVQSAVPVKRLMRRVFVASCLAILASPAVAQQSLDAQFVSTDTRGDVVHWIAERMYPPESAASEAVEPEVVESEGMLPPVTEQVTEGSIWQTGCSDCEPGCESCSGPFCWGRKCCNYGGMCNGQCRHTRVYRAFYLGHLWFDAELLAWSTKSQQALPLVTTSPEGTAIDDAGVLGLGTTSILAGNETLFDSLQPGGRLTGGWWFDADQCSGIELHYFAIDGEAIDFRRSSATTPILARPYTDSVTGLQESVLVAFPGTVTGEIRARVDMEFSGAGALWRRALSTGYRHRLDVLCGYRYTRLFDSVRTNEVLTSLDAASGFAPGLNITRFDRFRAENEFHGGELGLAGRWQRGCWSFELLGKTALGSSHRGILIDGQTTTTDNSVVPPVITVEPGGVLAQPSNLGSYTEDDLAFVSEVGVSVQYDLSCQLRASIGYSFIYWSDVSRVLDHVSPVIDPAQIPPAGGTGPSTFQFVTDDFWAQGLTAGFEYQF